MSAGDEDEILRALEKIEQDIVEGKFEWRDGQDVHTNIMEALVNMVGEHSKVLTTMNQADRCLSVLTTWYKDCIVPITTRIKRIQVLFLHYISKLMNFVFDAISLSLYNSFIFCLVLCIILNAIPSGFRL